MAILNPIQNVERPTTSVHPCPSPLSIEQRDLGLFRWVWFRYLHTYTYIKVYKCRLLHKSIILEWISFSM